VYICQARSDIPMPATDKLRAKMDATDRAPNLPRESPTPCACYPLFEKAWADAQFAYNVQSSNRVRNADQQSILRARETELDRCMHQERIENVRLNHVVQEQADADEEKQWLLFEEYRRGNYGAVYPTKPDSQSRR
jgi:hypothetical protein